MEITALDRVYLARAYELAARGIGNVSPNPPVGAVIVRDQQTLGEGFHHVRGGPHAEIMALRDAQSRGFGPADFAAATMYVSLEPCNHHGRTPPCSVAVTAAGFARVVIGALDPNPRTARGGVIALELTDIHVAVANDARAHALIAPFARAIQTGRPFVTLKLAAALNGNIAPGAGSYWLTGPAARRFVREERAAHDIVLVGVGTVRTDNPNLRPRPERTRLRPPLRAVVCGHIPPPIDADIFTEIAWSSSSSSSASPSQPSSSSLGTLNNRTGTWLIVPQAAIANYRAFQERGIDVIPVAHDVNNRVDIFAMLHALRDRDIGSILCEGGPLLASSLFAADCVDRLEWLIAPKLIATPQALQALPGNFGVRDLPAPTISQLDNDVRCSYALYDNPAGATDFHQNGTPHV